jgi:hypothetical protein
VELDACSKGCGAHFCVNHDIDFHGCRQLMECPHLEYDHVALQGKFQRCVESAALPM